MDTISKQQMAVLVARFVEFQEKFSPMSKADAQFVIQDTAAAIDIIIKAIAKRKTTKDWFECLNPVELPATEEVFDAQKYFWCDPEMPVRISECSINFVNWYYAKKETIKDRRLLKRVKLLVPLVSSEPIISSLGGEANVETFLVDIAYLLKQQPKGEKGLLDTDCNANIFFVKTAVGYIKEISVYWTGKGWAYQAHPLNSGHERNDCSIIFSY